jgi:DNA/RNA-binding domain of Phe-tRNA-synthetase-like protein
MRSDFELTAATGFVDPSVRAEFPGLGIRWLTVVGSPRRSPRAVRQRLHGLSDRYRGTSVVAMRTHAVPHAYRAFFRQVGLDPDAKRIPSEEVAVTRLMEGGFRSRDLVSDALLIALVETGVPVWALDAERVAPGGLGIRTTFAGEEFGSTGTRLAAGHLAVADAVRVHALLFGAIAPGHEVSPRTRRVTLFAVGVDGVPEIHVEEALWCCADILG